MRKIRTAVLISGRGSNMVALATAAQAENYPAQINLVISNVPSAAGLEKAEELGITAVAIDHKAFSRRREFEVALDAALKDADIESNKLAGLGGGEAQRDGHH